ncbi:MAG: hypothetical protein ABII64_06130 [Elusimicrobiota bacterium]
MNIRIFTPVVAFMIACAAPVIARAAFISSTFGEVSVDNLQPGRRYSIVKLANFPYNITNKGKMPVTLAIDVIKPEENQVKLGYEVISDTSWVKLEYSKIILNPNEKKTVDVYISVPDEEKNLGRKFEVDIWAHTIEKVEGLPVAVGLQSKLLLATAKFNESVQRQPGFWIEPDKAIIKGLSPGERADIVRVAGKILRVTNEYEETVEFNAETVFKGFPKESEDRKFKTDRKLSVELSETVFTLKPFESKDIKIAAVIPPGKKYYDKNFISVIKISARGKKSTAKYLKLYLSTKKK